MTHITQPAQTTSTYTKRASLGFTFGVSEFIYLVGLLLLAVGIFQMWGGAASMTATGAALLITAWINALAGDG